MSTEDEERDRKRKEQQAQAVANEVLKGSVVQSSSDYQAVLVSGSKVNHLLHFAITMVSCGFWACVWLFLALTGGEEVYIVNTPEHGTSLVQRRPKGPATKAILFAVGVFAFWIAMVYLRT